MKSVLRWAFMAFLTFSLRLKQKSFSTEVNSFEQSESNAYVSLSLQNLRPRPSAFSWTSPAIWGRAFSSHMSHARWVISLGPTVGTLPHSLAFSFIKHAGYWRYPIGNFFNIPWRSSSFPWIPTTWNLIQFYTVIPILPHIGPTPVKFYAVHEFQFCPWKQSKQTHTHKHSWPRADL